MKFILSCLLILSFVFATVSCSKNINNETISSGISGMWSIVTDSFPTGGPSMSHIETYDGQYGDYFDFRTDSNLYVKEGNNYSNLAYHITSDSTIAIADYFGGNTYLDVYRVSNLTKHTVTISIPWLYSPGGIFGRSIHLKR